MAKTLYFSNPWLHTTQTTNEFNQSQYYPEWYYGKLVVTADTGYKFDSEKTYIIESTRRDGKTFYNRGVPSEDYKQMTFTWNTSDTLLKGGSYQSNTLIPDVAFEVVNTIENTTETHSQSGSSVSLQVVGSLTNYRFTETPRAQYTTTYGGQTSLPLYVSVVGETSTASREFDDVNTAEPLTIVGKYEYVAPTITKPILQNLVNCTTNAPENISSDTENLTITATANENYIFESIPEFNINFADTTQTINFILSADGAVATANINISGIDFENVVNFSINANAVYVSRFINVSISTNNCTTDAPEKIFDTDTIINISATANENCIFKTAPQIYINDVSASPHVFNFIISEDGKNAMFAFDVAGFGFDNIGQIYISASAEVITPYSDKYGTINVYKVNTDNLAEFAAKRFFRGTDEHQESVDLGTFVTSLKRVYFNAGVTMPNVLKCGNYNTLINVETPLNDTITINCGFVDIPTYNNNITDYESEINLFLPFIGFVPLLSDYIGKTIYLQYVCNLITADAIAKLICDNVVIDVIECNLSTDLIYRTSNTPQFNTIGNVAFNMQVLKGLQPFANIKHFNALNTLYNNDCIRLQLSEVSGFAKLDEITNLNVNAIESEKELIISILQSGVIF